MLFKSDHFFQNEGRNRIKIANNSNLPNIIPILNTHLDKSGKLERLPLDPITEPNPGPTFDIEVAAPEIEVIKSKPLIESNIAIIRNINKNVKIKIITELIKLSEIF